MPYRREIVTSRTNNKPLVIRRTILVLIIIFAAVLQNTGIFPPRILGASALPLLPLALCISMFERGWAGILLSLLAGVFCDVPSAQGDGFHAIFFVIMSFIASLLISSIMRNSLASALLVGTAACIIYVIAYWLIFYVFRGYGESLFFSFYLPSAIYTLFFVPVFYFIIRSIFGKYQDVY